MSETPRTDVVLIAWDMSPEPKVLIDHARQLERELAAANRKIQRLVEAGDAMHETLSNPWNGGSSSNPECETWTAAKEEKAS